ncbi:hypothetical protein BDF19DRAFT_434232 [Syncephalis fuscata]|nr:hypothetical protein BDF19DRAFT_434232 [Syncephalis fuscata]
MYNQACPILCVVDPTNDCPASVQPKCPAGRKFCGDGACHSTCKGVDNVCACGGLSPTKPALQPCMSGQLVNIPSIDPSLNATAKSNITNNLCASRLSLNTSDIGFTDSPLAANGRHAWLSCPALPPPFFTYKEPMFQSQYIYFAVQFLIVGVWHIYKRIKERSFAITDASKVSKLTNTTQKPIENSTPPNEKVSERNSLSTYESESANDVKPQSIFKGYCNDYFGLFVFITIQITTVVNLAHKRIRNYFRLRSDLTSSNVVQIETRRDAVILLEDDSQWLKRLHLIEKRLSGLFGLDTIVSTVPIHSSADNSTDSDVSYFEYQCIRYILDTSSLGFQQHQYDMGHTHQDYCSRTQGHTDKSAADLRNLIGLNFISVHVPSFPMALLEEFQAFFYLYQLMCLWVWFYFAYYYMGFVQLVVILVSALVKVYLRLKAENKVKSLAEYKSDCNVLRNSQWASISTVELVPGDVIEIAENLQLPCDAAILSGEVVIDESSLTGESMPIRKFPMANDPVIYRPQGASKNNTLFAGTTVLTATPLDMNGKVTALVTATGTSTDKGKLVQKILFPSEVSFIFNEHLKGVICILLLWGIICFGLSLWLMGRGDITSWFYGLFVISQVMSPLLPAALVVGQSVAAARLRSKSIFCVDLPRVMIAGKIRVFCFDKTGTLTKEGLDYYGMCVTGPAGTPHHINALPSIARLGVATCHSVTMINGRVIGNPVDAEQFRACGWEIRSGDQPGYLDTLQPPNQENMEPVHIVKRFEFIHARASMSVAVLDATTKHVHVFMKGAFERVKNSCIPRTLPIDYDARAASYAAEGCYVLAIAHRDLGPISLDELRELTRDDLERDCEFVGLLLFKNQLKPDTTDAIAELKDGDTRTVMITGDNALTGVYIARQCGMVPSGARVLLGDIIPGGNTNDVEWRDVDTERVITDINAELSTSKAFDALVRTNQMRHLLLQTRIFARMTPDGKVECVQLFMERAVTAMCGDGGNDCGALRVAHCGIALSEAEASIVSPFSTSIRSIFSCVELVRQGRAALATSFAGYKFLIMYGETMCFLELIQYYFTAVVPQWVWVLIDGFVTVGLSYALTQAKPATRLAPQRPTARLLGPETLVSTITQVIINLLFFACGVLLLFRQPWFLCNELTHLCLVNYGITLPQFINAAATFNFGYRFAVRVVCYTVMMAFVSYIILADPNPVGCWFRANCGDPDVLVELGYPRPTWYIERYNSPLGHNVLPRDFRWTIWGYTMAIARSIFFREWAKRRFPSKRLQITR